MRPHLLQRLEEGKSQIDAVDSNDQGIDIVDYDFKGGIRVKTNRMFMNSDVTPPTGNRSKSM